MRPDAVPHSATDAGETPVRLLMLSWRGPTHPAAGGAERYTAEVLQRLAHRGHAITWFCEGPQTHLPGVQVVGGGPLPGLVLAGRRFARRHRREVDLVIDQINVVGFLTPFAFPIPHLALIHQRAADIWPHDRLWWRRRLGPRWEDWMLSRYRRSSFITVSRTTLADLRGEGWAGPGYVAYNGVRLSDRPRPRKEPVPTLVFLARLNAPGKRVGDAIAVHRQVRCQVPDAELWVIGRGTPPPAAPPGVRFFPDADDALRDDLLARAWLLIATSVREGWGRMILEAAACGTPCAVYGTPGLAEAAQAVEGTVTGANPDALAGAVVRLLRAPDQLRQAGARARLLAGGFTWERAADVWEIAMATTVGRPPRIPVT